MKTLIHRHPALTAIIGSAAVVLLVGLWPLAAQSAYAIYDTMIDTAAELDAIVADENIIVATEIDTEAEIVAIVGDLATIVQETDIDTEAEIVAIVSDLATIVQNTDIDTEAEVEALITDMANIIQATEIDTAAELDTLVADENLLVETEIDASSELLALMDDETGTGALVFGTAPTISGANITAAATVEIANGASPDATCSAGEIFLDTDQTDDTNCTTTADNSLCLCVATNTWAALENN